jgi:tetratricopeptide (TPR) repeat protein
MSAPVFNELMRLLALLPRVQPAPTLKPALSALFETLKSAAKGVALDAEYQIWIAWEWHASLQAANSLNVATGHLAAREFPEAEAKLTSLVAAYPTYAEAWNKRAVLYYLQGRDEASLTDICRTLELEPRHFGALAGAGQILARNARADLAEIAFASALAINPHLEGVSAALETLAQARGKRSVH